jgi:hypothetical protein
MQSNVLWTKNECSTILQLCTSYKTRIRAVRKGERGRNEGRKKRKNGIQCPTAFLVPELEVPALALVSTFNGFFSKLATYDDSCCSVAVSEMNVEKKMC